MDLIAAVAKDATAQEKAQAIQDQIDFLKRETTTWVPYKPRCVNQACAVLRNEYSNVTDNDYTQVFISTSVLEEVNTTLRQMPDKHWMGITDFNDSGTATKEQILEILIKTRDRLLASI